MLSLGHGLTHRPWHLAHANSSHTVMSCACARACVPQDLMWTLKWWPKVCIRRNVLLLISAPAYQLIKVICHRGMS